MTDLLPSPAKRPKRLNKQQVSTKAHNGHSLSGDEYLTLLCGCGKCTVTKFFQKGCPQPTTTLLETLPSLDMDGLSETDQLIRRGKLYLEYKRMCDLFSALESSVLQSLSERQMPVESASQMLSNVGAFHPPHAHTPLLSHQLTALKEAKNHSQLVKFVSSFTSFFNYSLLELLISKLGTDADKVELDKYKSHLSEYSKRNVLECPSYHETPTNVEFTELVLKVDEGFSKFPIIQLAMFMDWLASFLVISRASIQLVSIAKKESCHVDMVYPQLSKEVELVCRIATIVREEVLPISSPQGEILRSAGVLEIHCEEVHQIMDSMPPNSGALPISEHHTAEYLTMAQAAMLLNPPHSVHDQTVPPPKNGHAHDNLMRPPGYGESFLPPSSNVTFTQADLANQFLTSQADVTGNSSRDEQPSAEGPGSEVTDSDNDADKPKPKPAPGKKTRGRVKIPMKYIKNKLRRYTTFSKRKSNIMKKAYELSTLTGTQVMLMVASETGHVYTFATPKLQPMITSEAGKALIQTCLHQPDPPPTATAPPISSAEQFDVRMSSAGYEEVDLGAYKLATEEQKSMQNDKAPPTSLLTNLPPSFSSEIASLMPVLSSFRPPPLSLASPDYPPHLKNDRDRKE